MKTTKIKSTRGEAANISWMRIAPPNTQRLSRTHTHTLYYTYIETHTHTLYKLGIRGQLY